MVSLNRTQLRSLAPWGVALSATLIVGILFLAPLKNVHAEAALAIRSLERARALSARLPALTSEWETKRHFFKSNQARETVLNVWIKSLLTTAQSQGLNLEKLEPAGTKKEGKQSRVTVFVAFKGDIAKFSKFLFRLIEQDPLSQIESFYVRRQEAAKILSFEILLSKVI